VHRRISQWCDSSGASDSDVCKEEFMKQTMMSFSGSMLMIGLMVCGCAADAEGPTEEVHEAVPSQRVLTGATSARVFETFSDTNATGIRGQDFVYPSLALNLDAGTWLIEAEATVYTNDVPDALNLGLYNATDSADIAGSRSGICITSAARFSMPLHTSKVVTVTVPMLIQLKLFRNGSSTPGFGYLGTLAGGRQRLIAVELL
jgi:hypothetical protein